MTSLFLAVFFLFLGVEIRGQTSRPSATYSVYDTAAAAAAYVFYVDNIYIYIYIYMCMPGMH